MAGVLRKSRGSVVQLGLEVPGGSGTYLAAQSRSERLGTDGGGSGCPAGLGRGSCLPIPLDETVRLDQSIALAPEGGSLCGCECREHGRIDYVCRDLHKSA